MSQEILRFLKQSGGVSLETVREIAETGVDRISIGEADSPSNVARHWDGCDMSNGKVLTLDNVASTQDAALEHQLQAGDVCRSFNQTAGRGRRGAAWVASGGVAVTVVLEHAAPHLPIAIAATLASHLK